MDVPVYRSRPLAGCLSAAFGRMDINATITQDNHSNCAFLVLEYGGGDAVENSTSLLKI